MRSSPFGFVRDLVRPGMIVLDVGANVGSVTQAMRRAVGPTGRVYAIEPSARTIDEAQQAATRLWEADGGPMLAPVLWLTMALGRTDGEAILYHSDESARHTLYAPNRILPASGQDESVSVRSLNGLQAEGVLPQHIDIVKVDAQGAEDDIVAGASALLATAQTQWIIEVWPAGLYGAGTSVATLVDRLRGAYLEPADYSWSQVLALARDHHGHSAFDLVVRPS